LLGLPALSTQGFLPTGVAKLAFAAMPVQDEIRR